MKRIVANVVLMLVAATLAGCQGDRVSKPAAGGKRHAIKPPPVEAGARFFARDTAGAEHELKLHKLTVDVTTRPGTVRSHLSIEVAAPIEGQSEAIIRLPIPRGAAVTDAVLWVNDKPMRGAFVERQRANGIYTSIVTRRRDPALVAWDGPGWVAVSIFPLEKNRPRRFELEWVEPAAEADGRVQYRVPIVAEQDRIVGRASIKVDGHKLAGLAGGLIAIAPADPHKVVTQRAPGDPFQQVMVREPVPMDAPHFVLVVETSAALTAADRRRQRAMLDALLEDLPADAKVTMLAADWDVSPVVEDAGAASWPEALAKIDAIPSAGGLHLERALREAVERARKTGAGAVLFVGIAQDGFPGNGLAAQLTMFRNEGVRLTVVEVGMGEVPRPLAGAAAETGGEAITVHTFEESLPFLPEALRPRPRHPALDARGEGEWHVLRTVNGGAVWIGRAPDMEIPADAETARAEAGSPLAIDLASLWDRARLEWRNPDPADEVAQVLTPLTSLLVLETEQDYRRFGLDVPQPVAMEQAAAGRRHKGEEGKMGKKTSGNRKGLYGLPGPKDNADPHLAQEQARNAGTLGFLQQQDGSHIASIFGRDTALGQDSSSVLGGLIGNQVGAAYGVGGLALWGTGTGGGGTGEGSIGALGGRRAAAPDVQQGEATVQGSLDKEIIRRIVRRHINEVRYCYQQELAKFPGLQGRVVVRFTIGGNGDVIASVLQSSTVANGTLENCIVQTVHRWQFPYPHGSRIIISYPFVLTPGDGVTADDPIADALAILGGRGSIIERVERVSARLGRRPISRAEVLAWTIQRRGQGFQTSLLVARLLHLARRDHDAVRVLSESAGAAPQPIAAELRAIGAAGDAAEVLRLAMRR